MKIRIGRVGRVAKAALLSIAIIGASATVGAEAASATPGTPSTTVGCALGHLHWTFPTVTAQQPLRGYQGIEAALQAQLFQWNGRQWVSYKWSKVYTAPVYANSGYSLGTTWGYAGPTWTELGSTVSGTYAYWNTLPRGYYYTVKVSVLDTSNVISTAWATNFCLA